MSEHVSHFKTKVLPFKFSFPFSTAHQKSKNAKKQHSLQKNRWVEKVGPVMKKVVIAKSYELFLSSDFL